MAKQALAILVALSDVIWRPVKNFGRHAALVDNEQLRCEHAVLMEGGWDPNQPIEVSELDEEGLKDAERIIREQKAALDTVVNDSEYPTTPKSKLNAAQRREGFNAIYFPDGKLKLPKYDATFAFQRGGCLPDTIALKIAGGIKAADVVANYNLPVRIVKYANEAERIKACGLENTRKDTGRVSIMKHWPSLFQLAYDYFSAKPSANMSEITELLAGGVVKDNNDGIKVHSLLILDHRFPEAGIKDKILNAGFGPKGEDLGDIFASSLDRTRVWKMVQWLDAERAKKDSAQGVDYCTGKATTQDDVVSYLANPSEGKGTKVVMASKALVHTNMNSTPNMLEKYVLKAIATGNLAMLTKLRVPAITIEMLKECNALALKLGLVDEKGELKIN